MIADYQANIAKRDATIVNLEEEKASVSADFSKQLANVRDEFARMSEIAVKEQEELQAKIQDLEHELEAAQAAGAANSAGAALEQKKKIDTIQSEADAKLKKQEAKLEKLQKQLDDIKTHDQEQAGEVSELSK